MTKKTILLIALLICAGLCFGAAVTSSPYTGAGWNTAAPNDEALIGNSYQELQDLRKGVAIRVNKEHIDLASSSAGGEHMQGSARAFYLATASIPALQPDGTALAATDNGMMWHDTTTDIFYCLDDYSDPTVDGGWVSIGMLLGGVDVGASKFTVAPGTGNTVIAGTLTITGATTANSSITLGAGDDLIGSSTSDITIDTTAFTVAGATGNTGVGGTLTVTGESTFNNHINLGAGDDLIGSSTSDVNVGGTFTVAGATGNTVIGGTLSVTGAATFPGGIFSAYSRSDSEPVNMTVAHAYLATSDGFVAFNITCDDGEYYRAYVDTDTNPAAGGVVVASDRSNDASDTIGATFAVASGEYFEIVTTGTSDLIYWKSIGTLSAPVDQD